MSILVTGVTGTVGPFLARELEARGNVPFYLVRSNKENPVVRLEKVLGRRPLIRWRFAVEGDITLPDLGIPCRSLLWLEGRIEKIVNVAAFIGFDESSRKIAHDVNVQGMANVINLANKIGAREVHQVSTVYVAGEADSLPERCEKNGRGFRNVYEETKNEAEILLSENWPDFSIYRLPIVVGDRKTGEIPFFTGYYAFLKNLWHFRDTFKENSRRMCEGIFTDRDGFLNLPICLRFAETSTLNIVPVDWVAEMLAELISLPAEGKVFNVAHEKPPLGRWLNDVSLEALLIKGFYYGQKRELTGGSAIETYQKILDRNSKPYLPYIRHEAVFEMAETAKALGKKYYPCPEITRDFVHLILEYAKSRNFGKQ